jgi:hypothetical protein
MWFSGFPDRPVTPLTSSLRAAKRRGNPEKSVIASEAKQSRKKTWIASGLPPSQ